MHPVVHFEIIGADRNRLCDFYEAVFGWSIHRSEEMQYGLVGTGSARGFDGGIGASDNPAERGVRVYVGVPDIRERLDRAVGLGGEVVQPVMEIPNVVTMAVFRDPHGNTTGLVQQNGPIPERDDAGGVPVTWFEIIGRDPSIQDFYRELFDWKISDAAPVPGYGTVGWEEWGFGGGIGVVGDQAQPYVTIYPEVDDVAGILQKVTANGGTIVMEPTDMPEVGIRTSAFRDPDGNLIGTYTQIPNEG